MPLAVSTSGGAPGACRGFLRRYHTDRQKGLGQRPAPSPTCAAAGRGVPAIYPSGGT